MKRNFLTALFLSLAMVGGMSAQAAAADITFGGQLRPRFEVFEQNDYNGVTDPSYLIGTRIRLEANAKINDKTSAFIQMQARGVYGAGQATPGGAGASAGGLPGPLVDNRSSGVPSDALRDVGLHQAYFTLKDFFTLPVDLKFGRQEVVLDGHRLFGNTDWTHGAQAHDAIRLDHHHGEHLLSYIWIAATESAGTNPIKLGANLGGNPMGQTGFGGLFGQGGSTGAGAAAACLAGGGIAAGANQSDGCDRTDHVFYGNFKGILGGALSLYYTFTNDKTFNTPNTVGAAGTVTGAGITASNDIHTLGFRQAGNLFTLDYRLEAYLQLGQAEGISSIASTAGGALGGPFAALVGLAPAGNNVALNAARYGTYGNNNVDRRAWMVGVRLGKTFDQVMWKPGFTIWYDHLSGTSAGDVSNNRWGTFDTLYDTGHKYYGYMDTYLNPTGTDSAWLGLRDLAGKFSLKPRADLTLKADIHAFWTDVDMSSWLNSYGIANTTLLSGLSGTFAPAGSTKTVGSLGSHMGEELDLTAVYAYNPNTKITLGYSHYWADDLFYVVNGRLAQSAAGTSRLGQTNADGASWGYVMFDVKF
jgi:hypothetical protein